MPDTTLPLDDLTQRIAQHESELQRLRQEFEARQDRLAELNRQREDLQAQLRRVETDIEAVTRGKELAAPAPSAAPAKPAATRLTLSDALVEVAREANRPLTARELGEQLVLRNFPTASGNITNLVKNRLTDLVKRGVFRRIEGQPGVVLAASGGAKKAAAPNGAPAPVKPPMRRGQPSLRSLLTELLQKSSQPVPARVLAERVLATGYKTKSRAFTDVVWTALGQMKGVENVKGAGWRLRKS